MQRASRFFEERKAVAYPTQAKICMPGVWANDLQSA
jgi:hypothetical protein